MKSLILTIAIIGSIMDTQAETKKIVNATLNHATVFYSGAELKYSASAALSGGDSEVWITGFSNNIDKNSLRIGSSNGIVVTSYEFISNFKSVEQKPEILKMQDSVKIYKDRIKHLEMENKVSTQTKTLLENGMTQKFSAGDKGSSLEEIMKSMEYFKKQAMEIETSIAKNIKEIEKYTNDTNRLNAEIRKASKAMGALKLNLSVKSATTGTFSIGYCTYTARWVPYYSINVIAPEKPVNIISKAKIVQTTGVDWKNVKLTLSTGTPNNGGVAPIFSTWFISPNRPMLMGSKRAVMNSYAVKDMAAKSADADVAYESEDNSIALDEYLTVTDNDLIMSYNIDIPYTIPGNGKEQNIDLRTQTANADFRYYCAPKLNTDTYLLADIKDSQNLDLPAGKAQITYDGTYLGETVINGNSSLKDLSLTLGTDNRISVKREKMQDVTGKSSTFGSTVTQVFMYKITVKNNQKKEVKVTIKDQYPTSTQKEIEVALLKETTTPKSNNTETGVLTWEDSLQSGETKVYQISYSVKYPKDMDINL